MHCLHSHLFFFYPPIACRCWWSIRLVDHGNDQPQYPWRPIWHQRTFSRSYLGLNIQHKPQRFKRMRILRPLAWLLKPFQRNVWKSTLRKRNLLTWTLWWWNILLLSRSCRPISWLPRLTHFESRRLYSSWLPHLEHRRSRQHHIFVLWFLFWAVNSRRELWYLLGSSWFRGPFWWGQDRLPRWWSSMACISWRLASILRGLRRDRLIFWSCWGNCTCGSAVWVYRRLESDSLVVLRNDNKYPTSVWT